jgi:hypothetical protein
MKGVVRVNEIDIRVNIEVERLEDGWPFGTLGVFRILSTFAAIADLAKL